MNFTLASSSACYAIFPSIYSGPAIAICVYKVINTYNVLLVYEIYIPVTINSVVYFCQGFCTVKPLNANNSQQLQQETNTEK